MGDTPVDEHQITVVLDNRNHNNNHVDNNNTHAPSQSSSLSQPSILTSIHAGYFRITISFAAQALLWKTLRLRTDEESQPIIIRHLFKTLPSATFVLQWSLSLLVLLSLSSLYALKCLYHSRSVRAEFAHHIGANYLYAPWISWLLLIHSAPEALSGRHRIGVEVLWWMFAAPVAALDVKIYGQWFTAEKRFLSMAANPTSQMSVVGNLAGALSAAVMGWKESAVAMLSLAVAHYLVLFVTLYQRLVGGSRFPAMMRPSFFLFSAAPSLAALTWTAIAGEFDTLSKMMFFLSLFLFTSLACRPALFKKSMRRFNVVWWAYSFPLTFVALAASEYSEKEKNSFSSGLTLVLSTLSILVFMALMILTALNTNSLFAKNYSSSDYY